MINSRCRSQSLGCGGLLVGEVNLILAACEGLESMVVRVKATPFASGQL